MDSRRFDKPAAWLLGLWLILLSCHVLAEPVRLEVRDPYLDLHTGPGRGYPVTQSIARHSWIEIEYSHTDWYRVHAEHADGWVHRQQLQATLVAAGVETERRAVHCRSCDGQ